MISLPRRRPIVLIIILLASIMVAFGQSKNVTGTVVSKTDGLPLPGVSVVVQGTAKGTSSDGEGRFSIELSSTETVLLFSYVGFQSQTVDVSTLTTLNVELEEDAASLGEVVVIGYGTVRKSDLTGSVGSIKSEELLKVPSSNALQSLQGKIAGLSVINNSGAPGSAPIVRVRGIGTFNDNNPIYVVDGVILNDISFLNPSDIASIELLKDASATAIYGNRGSNGVFIVTTKQGKKGDSKMNINVSYEYTIQKLQKKIDLLSGKQFGEVVNQFKPGEYNNLDAVPNTDWQDLIFGSAPMQNLQISFSGSSSRNQYYFSVGYFKQEGIISKSDYERLTIRLNNTYQMSDWFKVGNNLSVVPTKQKNTSGNAPFVVYRAQPTIRPYLDSPRADTIYSVVPGVGNVLADIENINSSNKGIRAVGSFFAEATIQKDFKLKSSFGTDLSYSESESFTPVFYVSPQQQNPINDLNKGSSVYTSWLWENTLSYQKELSKDHHLDGVVGYTIQRLTNASTTRSGQNVSRTDPNFWYIDQNSVVPSSVADGVDPNQYFSMMSYLGRLNYNWKSKYLATVTFRRDGSSKFSDANRWGNFPSFALGWNIVNEGFAGNLKFLSNLKLRGSWGITGNDKISYLDRFSTVGIANAVFGSNEQQFAGLTFDRLGNDNLRWEQAQQTDVGVEFGIFNDKLTGEVDYYNRNTQDILVGLRVPGFVGNRDQLVIYNAGSMVNQGIELTLAWNGEIGKFKYKIGPNLTTINNEVTKITGTGSSDDELRAFFNGQKITSSRVGDPIGSFHGFVANGIFQNQTELNAYPHRSDAEPGDIRFVDTDNNQVINDNDRVNLGSAIPSFMFGLNLEGSYGPFKLSLDFAGQGGNKIYNAKETVRPDLYNYEAHVYNYWRGEGTSNSEPRPTAGGANFFLSDRFLYKGDFFRLRSLLVSFSIPKPILTKLSLTNADVYLRGTNIFTLSDFPGYSPEAAGGSAVFNNIDVSVYPVSSSYSIGVNISF
jgi:TonB-linked SusC/RagA family outer membrane protein